MGHEQNRETVRRGYEAFAQGDMETLMSLYTDDAVHVVPGSSQISGAHKGKESILELYGRLFDLTEGRLSLQLEEVLSDGGDRVVSIHRSTMERNGDVMRETEALLFTFVDGKVAEIQDFFGDIEANDRFFA
jgi:ketosteroid isomerase-like protein